MRVCDLDTQEIERQLVSYYNQAVIERDKRNRAEHEAFAGDFAKWQGTR